MATFRVGIGSFIITEDKGVGFGTSPTDGLGNLRVKGVTKTQDQLYLVHQHSPDTLVLLLIILINLKT